MPEITEWTFAADAAKWISLYSQGRSSSPFAEARVETKAAGSLKRRDLTVYDRDGKRALTGEIRFPDAQDGETPYNAKLVTDARRKARNAGAPCFFTWNVNRLVLWATDAEHEIKFFDVVRVRHGAEVEIPAVQRQIRDEFIPRFLDEYAAIFRGDEASAILPLDKRFIGRLESALENLANVVFHDALELYQRNRSFKKGLDTWMREQEWLLSDDEVLVRDNLDRATRLACYISANKLVFYQALRRSKRFRLDRATIPDHTDTGERLSLHFRGLFENAKRVTRDYQTIFDGGFIDRVPFITDAAVERWRLLVDLLNKFDFRRFDQDLIGHIFEGLLSPEERHRWGQHYTQPTIVDVINSFCIRRRDAVVLDPASGSGTFLVRAYGRKKHLACGGLSHAELLAQLYACEISDYAAHLTALNLATRDLIDGENFPRVARADFFDTTDDKPFCSVPNTSMRAATEALRDIALGRVDAVVGNPPYLEQTKIPKNDKRRYQELVGKEWRGLTLSGRSDLHVYFWPHACRLLPESGYFGFITSSSWLDTKYGFDLQRWILQNFELLAVMESVCEPWFTGARVATAVTVLRRCTDPEKLARNLVRFVQLRKPLKELLENDSTEMGRQEAAERLRDLIESTTCDTRTTAYRILVLPQQKLWEDGCKLACISGEDDEGEADVGGELSGYKGGKWGVYLRAPDLYFELMEKYGGRFRPLGEIAEVRRGVTSGCDDFFMPLDITQEALEETDPAEFRRRYHCRREEVVFGKVCIIRSYGEELPVESEYLMPEVQSLMHIESATIKRSEIRHRMLLVNKPLETLKGTHVLAYIRRGQREHFGGDTVLPKRPTCAGRPLWYDVTNYPCGSIVLPKLVKYRHIAPWNEEKLPVNCALMVVEAYDSKHNKALAAVLNSTLVALIKPYFSRTVGTEAHTQLDVYAANILPVPDVPELGEAALERLAVAFDRLGDRPITHLVEQRLLAAQNLSELQDKRLEPDELPLELQRADRQALDKEVLRAIGVSEDQVDSMLHRLYFEVTRFFNEGRVVELQANENKKRTKKGRVASPREVALEIFESLDAAQVRRFPEAFLLPGEPLDTVELPEGKARLYDPHDFYDAKSLGVGKAKISLRHRAQAELAKLFCDLHCIGLARVPVSEEACERMCRDWQRYHTDMQTVFRNLAAERADDEDRQDAIIAELNRLLVHRLSG